MATIHHAKPLTGAKTTPIISMLNFGKYATPSPITNYNDDYGSLTSGTTIVFKKSCVINYLICVSPSGNENLATFDLVFNNKKYATVRASNNITSGQEQRSGKIMAKKGDTLYFYQSDCSTWTTLFAATVWINNR